MYVSACQQQRGSSGYREEGPLSTNTNPIRYIAAYWGERERERMGEGTPSLCRETGGRGRGRRRHGCLLIRPLHVGEVLILWNRSHSHIRRDIYFIFNSRIMGPIGEDFVDTDLDLCLIYVHASSYLCLPSPSLSSSHPLHACCAGCSLSNTDAPSIKRD